MAEERRQRNRFQKERQTMAGNKIKIPIVVRQAGDAGRGGEEGRDKRNNVSGKEWQRREKESEKIDFRFRHVSLITVSSSAAC